MQVIKHRLDCHDEPIEVIPLADLHFGDSHADIDLIKKLINRIKHQPNTYCVLDGDLMNTAIIGSKSDIYSEKLNPNEQLKRCVELLSPLANDGKILAILTGNHEERIAKNAGINLSEVMSFELGIPEWYSATSTLLFLSFGRTYKDKHKHQVYGLYINHGFGGGGRRAGSKLNSLEDMSKIVANCDVYICGHTHLPAVFKQSCCVCDYQNMAMRQREQTFVNTASALNWSGSYGDRMGFKPNSKTYPIIKLDDKKHNVTVTL